MVYLITYDLNKKGQNYEKLYESIKSLGSCAHYLDSTWFVDTYRTSNDIRDILRNVMDSNDSLFVSKVTKSYSGWLPNEAWDWLSKHVTDF